MDSKKLIHLLKSAVLLQMEVEKVLCVLCAFVVISIFNTNTCSSRSVNEIQQNIYLMRISSRLHDVFFGE